MQAVWAEVVEMANELEHVIVGRALNRQEWEDVTTHQMDSGQTGDLIIATSATQLERLAIQAEGSRLRVVSGSPAWVA